MKPGAEVICRELGESAVLIHLGTNEIFELNSTGYRIWQMIREGADRDAMAARLVEDFDVEEATARGEIERLTRELAARGLIVTD